MPTKSMRSAALLGAVMLLGACVDHPKIGAPDNFGESYRQTIGAQIIDPNPVYDTAVPETSGGQAAAAIDRYRTDKVKLPDQVTTSDLMVSGGNGSQ